MRVLACVDKVAVLEVLLVSFIPVFLCFIEYVATALTTEGAAFKALGSSEASHRYFYEVLTAVAPVRGLSLSFVGLALSVEMFLNYEQMGKMLTQGNEHINPNLPVIVLLLLELAVLFSVLLAARRIYITDVAESINALVENPEQAKALAALHKLRRSVSSVVRRALVFCLCALGVAVPLSVFYLLTQCLVAE